MDQRDDPAGPRPRSPRPRGAGAVAVLVLAVPAVLAFLVATEVTDRRGEGFCRPDHGIVGATWSEEWNWAPLGDRCFLHLSGGATLVREPGWAFTGLVASWAAVVATGAAAPPASARRRLAWAAVVPAVPVAVLVAAVVQPRSPVRLVALTSISLGFGMPMGALTAVAVWAVLRSRVMPTVLGSWLAWAVVVFLQGRDSIGP